MVGFFGWFVDDIRSKGFDPDKDVLFVLGDVFNSRESVNLMLLEESINIFTRLSSVFKNGVHIVVGNHDTYYVDHNTINSVSFLSRMVDGVTCYQDSCVLDVNGVSLRILPWVTSFDSIHSTLGDDTSDYLFCHMDINGMKYSSGVDIDKCVRRDVLDKYKGVYSGHIHVRQYNGNVAYVGTPYQLDTGDIGNSRGYHYIDTTCGWELNYVENTFSPRFTIITMDKMLELSVPELNVLIGNSFVDVICNSRLFNKMDLVLFRKNLSELGVSFLKMEFTERMDTEGVDTVEDMLGKFTFDIYDSSISLLKSSKKTDSEIETVMGYFDILYKKVKMQ
jgi:hypothetical protein